MKLFLFLYVFAQASFVNASFMTSLAGGEDERVNKVVVRLDKAGELEDKVPENVWLDVVDTLKIIGPLNSYDLRWVRMLCGSVFITIEQPKLIRNIRV